MRTIWKRRSLPDSVTSRPYEPAGLLSPRRDTRIINSAPLWIVCVPHCFRREGRVQSSGCCCGCCAVLSESCVSSVPVPVLSSFPCLLSSLLLFSGHNTHLHIQTCNISFWTCSNYPIPSSTTHTERNRHDCFKGRLQIKHKRAFSQEKLHLQKTKKKNQANFFFFFLTLLLRQVYLFQHIS